MSGSARDMFDAMVTEKEFLDLVIETAKYLGYLTYHTFDSRRSEPGWLDLVLVNPDRAGLLVVELKTERGRVSAAQERWLAALLASGVKAMVWRPSDWSSGEVTAILEARPA